MRRSGKEAISKEIVTKILKSITKKNVLVIGDSMIDEYLLGNVQRISPEAPVPVFELESRKYVLGGAANTANNLVSLGSSVSLLTIVGQDESSKIFKTLCKNSNIKTDLFITDKSRPTTLKSRVMVGNHQIVRIDNEKKHICDDDINSQILNYVKRNCSIFDAVVFSDYAKGMLNRELVLNLIKIIKHNNKIIFSDPVPSTLDFYKGIDLIKPNKLEVESFLGEKFNIDYTNAEEIGNKLKSKTGSDFVITLGKDGMLFNKNGEYEIISTFSKEVFDVSGAGDTAMAALALARTCKFTMKESVMFANICSGIVVGKIGTATCSIDEIYTYLDEHLNK